MFTHDFAYQRTECCIYLRCIISFIVCLEPIKNTNSSATYCIETCKWTLILLMRELGSIYINVQYQFPSITNGCYATVGGKKGRECIAVKVLLAFLW